MTNSAAALLTPCRCVLRRSDDPIAPLLHAYLWSAPGGAQVAQSLAPDLLERLTLRP